MTATLQGQEMVDSVKDVSVFGRKLQLSGEPEDPYFANIEGNIASHAPLQAWAAKNLARDAVVIDVGGNIGVTALLLSSLVSDGHIHVFEANSMNVHHLRRNIVENGITNCTINAIALGNRETSVSVAGTGSSSHVEQVTSTDGHRLIDMTTLDCYRVAAGLQRIDFIKIDVEGYEPAVLDGAAGIIHDLSPSIWMEFNSWCLVNHHGINPRHFAELLWHSFEVYTLDQSGHEHPAGQGDLVAFLHANMVLHGTVDDILLYPKAGTYDCKFSEDAAVANHGIMITEIENLRSQVAAMLHSTSWRMTAPVRAAGRLFPSRKSGRNSPHRI